MCSGFPLRSFLAPYNKHFFSHAAKWWTHGGENICREDEILTFRVARGEVTFLRETSSFLLTVSKFTSESHGTRSWIFHPSRGILKDWDPQFEEIVSNDANKFPVPAGVIRLLKGDSVESVRKDKQEKLYERIEGFRNVLESTIEAELWFTLVCLEARIDTIWAKLGDCDDAQVIPNAEKAHVRKAATFPPTVLRNRSNPEGPTLPRTLTLTLPNWHQPERNGAAPSPREIGAVPTSFASGDIDTAYLTQVIGEDRERGEQMISDWMVHDIPFIKLDDTMSNFLALWISLCQEKDPFSPIEEVQIALEECFDKWQNDETPGVPEPPPEYLNITPPLPRLPAKDIPSKAAFYRWATVGQRKRDIVSLVPLLQLRGILIYHFLHCRGDSSDVAGAESYRLQVRFG